MGFDLKTDLQRAFNGQPSARARCLRCARPQPVVGYMARLVVSKGGEKLSGEHGEFTEGAAMLFP